MLCVVVCCLCMVLCDFSVSNSTVCSFVVVVIVYVFVVCVWCGVTSVCRDQMCVRLLLLCCVCVVLYVVCLLFAVYVWCCVT